MEFVVGDGDGEVGFCFATRGEAGEELGVKEGDPGRLRRGAPVKKCEKGACRIVDAWVLWFC